MPADETVKWFRKNVYRLIPSDGLFKNASINRPPGLMSVYFLYHEVSSYRRELIGRADTEGQARAKAMEQSRRDQRTVSIREYSPSTMCMRLVGFFRGGVQHTERAL